MHPQISLMVDFIVISNSLWWLICFVCGSRIWLVTFLWFILRWKSWRFRGGVIRKLGVRDGMLTKTSFQIKFLWELPFMCFYLFIIFYIFLIILFIYYFFFFLKSYGWGCYAWNDLFVCQNLPVLLWFILWKELLLFYFISFFLLKWSMECCRLEAEFHIICSLTWLKLWIW